jgi:peroxiredoxin/uncharacterized coiled-coil protein SlyX
MIPVSALWLAALVGCVPPKTMARIEALEAQNAAQQAQIDALNERLPERPIEPTRDPAAAKLFAEASEAINAADYALAREKLAELRRQYPNDDVIKRIARTEAELAVIGVRAKPEGLTWIQGADTLDQGLTLVVFFEAWCPHCRREMPKLQEDLPAWTSRGVRLIGLTKQTRDVTDETLADFLREGNISFPIAREDGKMTEQLAITGIPAAAILRDGVVIWRGHPARLTDELVTKVLATP